MAKSKISTRINQQSRRLVGLTFLLALVISIPILVWGLTTGNFDIRERAESAETTLNMVNSPSSLQPGQQGTLLIQAIGKNSQGITGVETHLSYDPNVIKNIQILRNPDYPTILREEIDTVNGNISLAYGVDLENPNPQNLVEIPISFTIDPQASGNTVFSFIGSDSNIVTLEGSSINELNRIISKEITVQITTPVGPEDVTLTADIAEYSIVQPNQTVRFKATFKLPDQSSERCVNNQTSARIQALSEDWEIATFETTDEQYWTYNINESNGTQTLDYQGPCGITTTINFSAIVRTTEKNKNIYIVAQLPAVGSSPSLNWGYPLKTGGVSTPQAESCSSVTVEGATFVKTYEGQNGTYYLYSIESGATARLTANTSPPNSYVKWVIGGSSKLPNAGTLTYPYPDNTSIVNWTAPNNPTDTEQGVDVRGDYSEYPNEWKHCPIVTFAVQPQSQQPEDNYTINFKVKFAGLEGDVNEKYYNSDGTTLAPRVRLIFAGPNTDIPPTNPPTVVTHLGNGVYAGSILVPKTQLPVGQYNIYVKGEKHLSRRFCLPEGQSGICPPNQFAIEITDAQNTYNFDFSGLELRVGDLPGFDGELHANSRLQVDTSPQNDRADIQDYLKIEQGKGVSDSEPLEPFLNALFVADLNYDGKVTGEDSRVFWTSFGVQTGDYGQYGQ